MGPMAPKKGEAWNSMSIDTLINTGNLMDDRRWREVALLMDEASQVYAARVDSTYSSACLTRTTFGSRSGGWFLAYPEDAKGDAQTMTPDEQRRSDMAAPGGRAFDKTLAREVLEQLDLEEGMDPYFKRVRAEVESGAGDSGLLLNLLPPTAHGGLIWAGSTPLHDEGIGFQLGDGLVLPTLDPERICAALDTYSEELKEIQLVGPDSSSPRAKAARTGRGFLLPEDLPALDCSPASKSEDVTLDTVEIHRELKYAWSPDELDGMMSSVAQSAELAQKASVDALLPKVETSDFGYFAIDYHESDEDPVEYPVTPQQKRRKVDYTSGSLRAPYTVMRPEGLLVRDEMEIDSPVTMDRKGGSKLKRGLAFTVARVQSNSTGQLRGELLDGGWVTLKTDDQVPWAEKVKAVKPELTPEKKRQLSRVQKRKQAMQKERRAAMRDRDDDEPAKPPARHRLDALLREEDGLKPKTKKEYEAEEEKRSRNLRASLAVKQEADDDEAFGDPPVLEPIQYGVEKEPEKKQKRFHRYLDPRTVKAAVKAVPRPVPFSKLLSETTRRLPSENRQQLTPALGFVCLLHLATETGLQLEQPAGTLGDFKVR